MSERQDDIRPLVRRLQKAPEDFRRADLVQMCIDDGVRVLNLRYPSFDGKLRELRVPVRSRDHLDRTLAAGERVDGSSLFPGLFDASRSDLYVVPVYRWAFPNPWASDELDIVCRFIDGDGNPCRDTPDTALAGATARVTEAGLQLHALAELEFYLLSERLDDRFSAKAQRNYHQGTPYLHQRAIADEILRTTSAVMGHVKYCHAEVGYIDRLQSEDPEIDGRRAEQYEFEMDLMPMEDLGTWLTVARWLVRAIAARHQASVTFVPKLDEGMAGNGMHVHLALIESGRNVMMAGGELSDVALRTIGGLLRHVQSLAAFGNTVTSSYLRLVPGQEAPTRPTWGYSNRGGLLRVPLSFSTANRLDRTVNPEEDGAYPTDLARPTVELRLPDGSAFSHALLAAITACVEQGLGDADTLTEARRAQITDDADSVPETPGRSLPSCAVEAAAALRGDRAFYESAGLSPRLIDLVIDRLEAEADAGLSSRLAALPPAQRLAESRRLMHKDLHKH
jgi:glutamine synthetase